MALPHGGVRIVFGGELASGGGWSIGLSCAVQNRPDSLALTEWLSGFDPGVKDTFNNGGAGWGAMASSGTTFSELRAYAYDAGAKAAYAVAQVPLASPINGAGGDGAPALLACVASLTTRIAGRSGRGRVYCPADGAFLTQHQFRMQSMQYVATGIAQLVRLVDASVLDAGSVSAVVGGKIYPYPGIDRIVVDSKPDTQHRREDKMMNVSRAYGDPQNA